MGYEIYHSRAGIIGGTVALQIISSTCIGLRFYTRWWRAQRVLLSDWLVLAAFVCGTGLSGMEIYGVVVHSFGTPLDTTSHIAQGFNERLLRTNHMEFAFVLVGIFSIGLVKLSVSLLYWHIFARVRFRRFLIFWIVILVSWTLCFVIGEIFQCGVHPLKVFGTRKDVQQYCPAIHDLGYALVASDVATDLGTLVIPLPLVLRMRLPTTQKILVTATFLMGGLAVGASTAKAYIYISASLALAKEDGLILLTAYSVWNLVEVHVGIIAACGITLRPILTRFFPGTRFLELFPSLKKRHSGPREDSGFEDLPSFVRRRDTEAPRGGDQRGEKAMDERRKRPEELRFQTSALPEVV